jgi:type II secretion system protein H
MRNGAVCFFPNSAFRTPHSNRGFTLVEIILVSAILVILLLASVPRFSQTAQRLRVEQAAFELTQLLRVAHERAVFEGQDILWVWDGRARRARIEPGSSETFREPQDSGQPFSSRVLAESSPCPEGMSVSLTRTREPLDCNCVRFFPEGTSEPTTLTMSFRERVYTVTVDEATSQALLSTGLAPR